MVYCIIMANIYYPQGSRIIERNTVSSSYYEEVISVLPNVVFFFNSGSQLDWISSSVFTLTASVAITSITSSYAGTSSVALNVPETSSYALQALSSSYSDTASYAANSSPSTFTSVVVICGGYSPNYLGADWAEIPIPYNPNDGTSSIVWDIKRIDFRVAIAGGAPYLKVEKSTSTASFSASLVDNIYLDTGSYQTSSLVVGQTIQSGDKVRMNVENLGTAIGWTLTAHLKQT